MKTSKIVVTGDHIFLYRYKLLFEKMSTYFEQVECLPSAHFLSENLIIRKIKSLSFNFTRTVAPVKAERFYKNTQNFITRSKQTEQKLKQLRYTPDLVFHIFNLCCPVWEDLDTPYAMYLDYTMSLLYKNWRPGSPFYNQAELTSWLDVERRAYKQASYLFTMSHLVKSSLINDYGIAPARITVVGSAANHQKFYQHEKVFGTQQILFNGSEFERKGGDLVLAAFEQVKQALPNAKLVVIGKKLRQQQQGVENPGEISSPDEMRNLFLNTDLVVAPARCDPFPSFIIEAMNYGVPCIVSARDGMPEIVDHGVNGVVLEQLTPESLASQILQTLGDISTLTTMSRQAQHKVKTQLNWDCVAKKIAQVLLT